MAEFLKAIIVAAAGGLLSIVVGQSMPRVWFYYDGFPYAAWKWENGGRIYDKIKIRSWKDRMPDLSKILPGVVKKKAMLARTPESMDTLIRETCVAEAVHWGLIFVVSPLIHWCSYFFLAVIYALGNLVFIIIQRYNRPRLREILRRMEMRNNKCL